MTPTLTGLRILNTRPTHQAKALSQAIQDAQGIAIECPMLEIKATTNCWIKTLPDLKTVQYAIFISANAVSYCFTQLQLSAICWPAHIKVIAIGQATAKELSQFNIVVTSLSSESTSENLLSLNTLQKLNNQTVLLFKGKAGRTLIKESLLKRGARVITVNVYKRVLPKFSPHFIQSIWHNDLIDIILLTSEQSIHNLFKLFSKKSHDWLQAKPCIVISTRLAKTAASYGIKKIIITHPAQVMHTLFEYHKGIRYG